MLCEILRVYLTTRRFIMKEIKWAVLGTGVIANQMAQALIKNGKNIYSVAKGC